MTEEFLARFAALPSGYSEGEFDGRRYGVTKAITPDSKRSNLYGEELGGNNHISFNLYRLTSGLRLKPCEMPAAKVIDFVLRFRPTHPA